VISVDSFGWIERFTDGPKASQYNHLIDSSKPDDIVTSVVVIYEVYRRVKESKGEQVALEAVATLTQTRIVTLDKTLCLEAADLSLEHNLHFADALVYATARHYGVNLYTSDKDMRGLKGIKYL
jgi:predicted nucleic acid-binding protein